MAVSSARSSARDLRARLRHSLFGQTALDIYAKDRLDLVLDVSAALSSSQTRVASINATTTADGFAVIHLSIFISDAQHLAAVMRRLHQISGVMKVDRPAG